MTQNISKAKKKYTTDHNTVELDNKLVHHK